jgi:hypothetical protein
MQSHQAELRRPHFRLGTKQTCSMRRRMSAFGSKPDIDQPLLTNLDL